MVKNLKTLLTKGNSLGKTSQETDGLHGSSAILVLPSWQLGQLGSAQGWERTIVFLNIPQWGCGRH